MIPHLRNLLRTFPIRLIMLAVLDQWFRLPHREWDHDDLERALPTNITKPLMAYQRRTFLGAQTDIRFFNRLLHVINLPSDIKIPSLPTVVKQLLDEQRSAGAFDGIRLPIPIMDKLYQYDDDDLGQSLLTLPDILGALGQHALTTDLASYIVASPPDQALHHATVTTTSSFLR